MYKEDERIELKKSLAQLKEGIISLSAMLNKNYCGELYFGINDEGKIVGLQLGKKTISDLTHEIQNNLKPLPNNVEIKEEIIENKRILKIIVNGNDTPYSAYGRYYIRINDADILMSSYQLQYYFINKENTYINWEQEETKYGIDDINEELLIECIRTANEKGRLNYVYRNSAEALNKLGLLTENNKLNNAGYYLFSNKKPIKIKLANYPTDSRIEFGEIKEFKGNIFECIQESFSYIQNHISYKSNIEGIRRVEIPEIPLKALREIIINSFAHCSYSIKGDYNQYVIYKSSVRIYNPGSIFKNIDPVRFANGQIGSKIRNILIADVLYKFGYIDSFGTGFERTFALCNQNQISYKYLNDEFGFTFIFDRKVDFLEQKEEAKLNKKISQIDKLIMEFINDNQYITIPELANKINKSEPTIYRHLDNLVKENVIERIGSRKSGYWNIKD